jgi:hypothetical protein
MAVVDVTTGVFGLVGVVVGAATTTGTQLFIDWKRERREGARAKVLVTGELLQAQRIMQALALGKRWPNDPDSMLPTSAWRENRTRLAGHINEDTFNRLVMVYSVLEIDRSRMVMSATGSADMSDTESKLLNKNANEIGDLRRVMGAHGDWPDYTEDELKSMGVKPQG